MHKQPKEDTVVGLPQRTPFLRSRPARRWAVDRLLSALVLAAGCIAAGQSAAAGPGVAAPPALLPAKHVPAHAPSLSRTAQRRPLVPNGTTFSSNGPQPQAFPSSFTAIGPAPINTGFSYGNASGRIAALAVDPTDNNVIYVAAAGGGVWKTSNGGTSWAPLTDQLPDLAMGALTIDPTNHNVIYAGSGEANFAGDSRYGVGVYKSSNGGSSWTVYTGPNNAFSGLAISRIVVDPVTPSNVYLTAAYAGENGTGSAYGVYKSTDSGVTWTAVLQTNPAAPFSDLAIDPTTPQTLYAAAGDIFGNSSNGIYKTTDAGAHWTLLSGFPNGTQSSSPVGRISLALAPSNPQVLYADYSSNGIGGSFGSLGAFYRTVNGGTTWSQIAKSTDGTGATGVPNFLGTQGWYDNVLVVHPTNANEVFAAGVINYDASSAGQYVAIIGSYDGGATWTDYTYGTNFSGPHTDHHGLAFTADGTKLLDGNDGGIWRCENPNTSQAMNTIQWTNLNTNLGITQFTGVALHPTDPTIVYGGSQDNGTEKYTGSLTWSAVRGGDGGFTRVDQSNPNTVYHEYYGISLERSDDAGGSWTNLAGTTGINPNDPVIDDGDDPAAFYVPYILDPANQSRILYGTDHLYESVDKGAHFTAIGSPDTAGFNPGGYTIRALGAYGSTIYVSVGNVICVTTNDGAAWSSLTPPGFGGVNDFYVNPANAQDVIAALPNFGGGNIYRSTNGGTSWTNISGNLPVEPFNAIKVDPASGTFFAGGDDGVYFSTDSGATWTRSAMPNVQVVDLAISAGAGKIAAGTHGRGVFESALTGGAAAPAITSATAATAALNKPFTYQITASNTPTSYSATGLRDGLSINTTTGVISGSPPTAGTLRLTVSATNAAGTGSAILTITVVAPPAITSATTATAALNKPFTYQITASNSPTSFGASGLRDGLSLNGTTGVISGTPPTAGTLRLTLSATNSAGTGSAVLTITVVAPPVINSATSASATLNQAFTYEITATNNPTSYTATGLRDGLSLNASTGVISGTPTTAGTVRLTIGATNNAGTGTQALTITITGAPVVTSARTANATIKSPFSYRIVATNNPTSYAATGLRDGLSLNASTGVISGTPGTAGTVKLTLSATNSTGTGTAPLTITVASQ